MIVSIVVFSALIAAPLSREQVASINADYVVAMQRRDADRATAPYAQDAVFISARNRVIQGRAAITDMLRERLRTTAVTGGSCTTDSLHSTESEAWETGSCRLQIKTASGVRMAGGRYMTYWKRQPNGAWLIDANIAE